MKLHPRALAIGLLSLCCSAQAQESPAPPPTPPPADKPAGNTRYRIELQDGTRILGRLDLDAVVLETDYGPLSVPLADVFELRMAARLQPAEVEEISQQIALLADPAYPVREGAQRVLLRIGERALSMLETAARDTDDLEVRARIEEMQADIAPEGDEDSPFTAPRDDDELVARKFSARGRVTRERFEISTAYGTLHVNREDLRRVVFQKPLRTTFQVKVTGANAAGSTWVDSSVQVAPGDRFRVEASGGILAAQWGIRFSPDGDPHYGTYAPGIPSGALVCRIGADGDSMLIGSSATKEVERAGTLRFAAAIQDLGKQDAKSGEWQVKVTVLHSAEVEDR